MIFKKADEKKSLYAYFATDCTPIPKETFLEGSVSCCVKDIADWGEPFKGRILRLVHISYRSTTPPDVICIYGQWFVNINSNNSKSLYFNFTEFEHLTCMKLAFLAICEKKRNYIKPACVNSSGFMQIRDDKRYQKHTAFSHAHRELIDVHQPSVPPITHTQQDIPHNLQLKNEKVQSNKMNNRLSFTWDVFVPFFRVLRKRTPLLVVCAPPRNSIKIKSYPSLSLIWNCQPLW